MDCALPTVCPSAHRAVRRPHFNRVKVCVGCLYLHNFIHTTIRTGASVFGKFGQPVNPFAPSTSKVSKTDVHKDSDAIKGLLFLTMSEWQRMPRKAYIAFKVCHPSIPRSSATPPSTLLPTGPTKCPLQALVQVCESPHFLPPSIVAGTIDDGDEIDDNDQDLSDTESNVIGGTLGHTFDTVYVTR
jgi:hypothetical protein